MGRLSKCSSIVEHKLPTAHVLAELANKYRFKDTRQFTHAIRAAFMAYYNALYDEPPSRAKKRLQRRAAGKGTLKESHTEHLFVKMAEMNGAVNKIQAAADMLADGYRSKSAEGLFVQRLIAIWHEAHGHPRYYSITRRDSDEGGQEKYAFIRFMEDINRSIQPNHIWTTYPERLTRKIIEGLDTQK